MSHASFMPSALRRFFLCLMICVLVPGITLQAQEGRASINGTVTDQSGAFIEGATVTARETATGQTRTAISANNGTYVLPLLPVGPYARSCTHPGFVTQRCS